MQLKTILLISGAVIVAVGAGAYYRLGSDMKVETARAPVPFVTPPGITLQAVGATLAPGGVFSGIFARNAKGFAFADAKGKTLYTYDKDTEANKSSCVDDCIKAWPAAVAPANAVAVGEWTVITRPDGATKQWALHGKPLYTFVKDEQVGHDKGNGSANGIWHTAMFQPSEGVTLPNGIAVQEIVDAQGTALVDERGMTLYTFDGDAKRAHAAACKAVAGAEPCADHWKPFAAAQIARPVGDFTLVDRAEDGIKQWAYKGDALYTYDGDLQPFDATGIGVEKGWHAAMISQTFIPSEARLQSTPHMGKIMANAQGMTLYRREGHLFRTGGHSIPRSVPGVPALGRAIGTAGCNAECLKTWHPLVAPATAQPSGYWDIVSRDDDTRQWAYKGYPMYTYAGDKKPGDTTGYDTYDIMVSDGIHQVDYTIQPTTSQFSLFWTTVDP